MRWFAYLWEFDPEFASFAEFGFDTDTATHTLSAFLDDGKAQAGAWKILFSMQTLENTKYFAQILGLDSDPVILDVEPDKLRPSV